MHIQTQGNRVIVFCATKRMCDQLERQMGQHQHQGGVAAAAIHGDKVRGLPCVVCRGDHKKMTQR